MDFFLSMNDVTQILSDIHQGAATDKLLPLVYRELRRLAAQKMASERLDHTFEATALVHEAYIRLVNSQTSQHWNGLGHFYSAAAEAMRRILIESARRRSALKRGANNLQRVPLDLVEPITHSTDTRSAEKMLAVDSALNRLADLDPAKAKLIELRFFAGLTIEEAAEAMQISTATANRMWAFARAWLQTEIESSNNF